LKRESLPLDGLSARFNGLSTRLFAVSASAARRRRPALNQSID